MDKIYISPLAFAGSDREKIQAAVEERITECDYGFAVKSVIRYHHFLLC